jgi:hypothetical protein
VNRRGFYPTRRAFPGSEYYLVHDADVNEEPLLRAEIAAPPRA